MRQRARARECASMSTGTSTVPPLLLLLLLLPLLLLPCLLAAQAPPRASVATLTVMRSGGAPPAPAHVGPHSSTRLDAPPGSALGTAAPREAARGRKRRRGVRRRRRGVL